MRLLTLFSVSTVVADYFVDESYTVAVRDSSVTGLGYEEDKTEMLKSWNRKAGGYGGGRREES